MLLSCLILAFFAGFRDRTIGSDTDFYPHWYIEELKYIHSFYDLVTIETEMNLDKGFLGLYWIGSWISNKYWIGLFLTEFVISFFCFMGFVRLSKHFDGGMSIFTITYLFLVFNYSLNAMRQECAISICFYAFSYLWEKKWVPYICWTMLAYTFHSSAIITMVLPLFLIISNIQSDKKRNLFLFCCVIALAIIAFSFWTLLSMIGDIGLFNEAYAARYGESGEFEGSERVPLAPLILCFIIYVIMYLSYKNGAIDKKGFTFHILVTTVYVFGITLQTLNVYLYRVALYFYVISIYFFAIELSSKKTMPLMRLAGISYLFVYWVFLYVIKNTSETYPYTSKILGID